MSFQQEDNPMNELIFLLAAFAGGASALMLVEAALDIIHLWKQERRQ